MVTVCQKCGDPGYAEHLVYCSSCLISAEHRYCLNNYAGNDEMSWSCEECRPRRPEVVVKQNRSINAKMLDNIFGASKVASRHNPHLHRTCESDMHVESPGCSIDANCTPASSMVEVREVSRHFAMQVQNKSKRSRRRLLLLKDDLDQVFRTSNVVSERRLHAKNENASSTIHDDDKMAKRIHVKRPRQHSRRRRLILLDNGSSDEDCETNDIVKERQVKLTKLKELKSNDGNFDQVTSGSHQNSLTYNGTSICSPMKLYAQPIINHIWRGYFDVCNKEIGPIRAHISSRACERVQNIACKLPPVLSLTKLSRLDSWPSSFSISPPNDGSIALYFFDDNARLGTELSKLLDNVTRDDLVLKFVHDEAELLAFSSIILPESCQKFQGKHYLWGVFRRRQDLVSAAPADSCPNLYEKNISVEVNDSNHSLERHDECHGANACHNTQVGTINFGLPQHFEDGSPNSNKILGERESIPDFDRVAENMVDGVPGCDMNLKQWREQQHVDNSKNYSEVEWHDLEDASNNVLEDIRCRADSKHSAKKMVDDSIACNAIVEQQLVRNWSYSGVEQVECRNGDACSKCSIHLGSRHCPADCCSNTNEKSDINPEKVLDDIAERNISIEQRMCTITFLDYLASCKKHASGDNVIGKHSLVEPSSEQEKTYQGDDKTINHSLNLFPMRIEDIAITSRLGDNNSIDLDLGIGWTSRFKDTKSRNDLAKDFSLDSTTSLS